MKTIGDFHDMANRLMEVADFCESHGDFKKRNILRKLVQELLDEHLELAKGLKKTDPYFISIKYIQDWLDQKNLTETV